MGQLESIQQRLACLVTVGQSPPCRRRVQWCRLALCDKRDVTRGNTTLSIHKARPAHAHRAAIGLVASEKIDGVNTHLATGIAAIECACGGGGERGEGRAEIDADGHSRARCSRCEARSIDALKLHDVMLP